MEIPRYYKIIKNTLLCLIIIFCCSQKGVTQNNTIKFTPIKTFFGKANLAYERKISKRNFIITDFQFWYLDEKEREKETLSFIVNESTVLESNNGARISLELRTYRTALKKEDNKISLFLGVGGFSGWHDISMIRESYVTQDWGGNRRVPELSGEVKLISSGAHFNTGVQFALGENLKFEFGLIAGKAWANQENDHLTLYQYDPYVLEEDRVKYNQVFLKEIDRIFFETMFLMGVSF